MPDRDPLSPFDESDFDKIEASLANSMRIEEGIKKANRAGIELPGVLEDVRKARVNLQRIKQTYFPDR